MGKYFSFGLSLCMIITLLFNVVTFAESSDIEEIQKLLKQGSIEGYNTILIPLKGDPANFNIKPTDNIKNIQFDKGLEGYTFRFDLLKNIINNDTNNLDINELIITKNQYYFSVVISGRNIGMAEVHKIDNKYKVISMSSGGLLKNIKKATEIIEKSYKNKDIKTFYIQEYPYFNGYLIKTDEEYSFISIEDVTYDNKIQSFEIIPSKDLLDEIYSKYKGMKSSDNKLSGGGIIANKEDNESFLLMGVISVLLIGGLVFLIIRKRTVDSRK